MHARLIFNLILSSAEDPRNSFTRVAAVTSFPSSYAIEDGTVLFRTGTTAINQKSTEHGTIPPNRPQRLD
jgi:hypothetical protein